MRRQLCLMVVGALMACSGRPPAASPARPEPRPAPTAPEPAAPPPGGTSLNEVIAEDMASENAMPWSATRRLVWRDFKGKPATSGNEGARTAHAIHFAWICRPGGRFEFKVTAGFLPNRSWVKRVVLQSATESVRVLRHEQTHFDISELYARHIRRRFAELTNACARKDTELNALARALLEEEKAFQRRYDSETRNSLETERQNAWEENVRRLLASSSRYAQ
jgi:hypothetical protein